MIYALDSNVVIHAMKGMGNVAAKLARVSPDQITIPAVVAYELKFGALRSGNPAGRRRDLERLLEAVRVLPFDEACAEHAADLRFQLEQAGKSIGPMDVLIAGTALANGARLVTHNLREFERVPGLKAEDWY